MPQYGSLHIVNMYPPPITQTRIDTSYITESASNCRGLNFDSPPSYPALITDRQTIEFYQISRTLDEQQINNNRLGMVENCVPHVSPEATPPCPLDRPSVASAVYATFIAYSNRRRRIARFGLPVIRMYGARRMLEGTIGKCPVVLV